MARDTIAEKIDGKEEAEVRKFVDLICPRVAQLGCEITTQVDLPYTNFCDRIDANGKGLDYAKGKKSYTVDVLISRKLQSGESIPLVVLEGKICGYSTHDIIVYSEKARTHKTVFPHLQYGFIVLNAHDEEFMPLRYYSHSNFDFEEIFPVHEEPVKRNERLDAFVDQLERQIKIAERKHRIFFK